MSKKIIKKLEVLFRKTKTCIKKIKTYILEIDKKLQEGRRDFKYYLYNYHVSYFPNWKFRLFYIKNILRYKIGANTFVHIGCYFNGNKIKIGDNTVIGRSCSMVGEITIGNNCSITAYTMIQAASHDKNSPIFAGTYNPIIIGNYVWIGMNAVVLPGVTIGDGAIIGANSTLTGDVPECKVFAGSPAREVSDRARDALAYTLNYHPPFN